MKCRDYILQLLVIYQEKLTNSTISNREIDEFFQATLALPESPPNTIKKFFHFEDEIIITPKTILKEFIDALGPKLSEIQLHNLVDRLLKYETESSVAGTILRTDSFAKALLIYEAKKYKFAEIVYDNFINKRQDIFGDFHIPKILKQHYQKVIIPSLMDGDRSYQLNPVRTVAAHLLFNVLNSLIIEKFSEDSPRNVLEQMKDFETQSKAALSNLMEMIYNEILEPKIDIKVLPPKEKCDIKELCLTYFEQISHRPITGLMLAISLICSIVASTPVIFCAVIACLAGLTKLQIFFHDNLVSNNTIKEENPVPVVMQIARRRSSVRMPEPLDLKMIEQYGDDRPAGWVDRIERSKTSMSSVESDSAISEKSRRSSGSQPLLERIRRFSISQDSTPSI